MPNRLARETSPYLRQHAGNPVDWHPWGEEALARARESDRPILLSIGYSACHWCHVMAHECFEDAETAALMNRHFVNIKVDREERPDLDQIYQVAHQLVSRRPGGWPLTMFLTPEGKPFFGGTFFPKRSRYNLPGFDDLLQGVAQLWRQQRAQIESQGDALARHLAATLPSPPEDGTAALAEIAPRALRALRDALMLSFDPQHGGFGPAPKFPHPSNLDALLRQGVAQPDPLARQAALLTLQRMAEGGLFDQLGGGFFRYSTDERWLIPHFEKMLYDNGPLLRVYAEAWQLTGAPLFRRVCEQTAAWLMREMQSPAGGFFSSIDADSEGEEGRFYVWRREEIRQSLSEAEYALFAPRYGLDEPPNFESRAWHLHLAEPGVDDGEAAIDAVRERLFAQRETRVRPGRDEKVLASWNALAVDGLAFAGRVFGEPSWTASARRALDFVLRALWRGGRLLAAHKDGRSHLNAYLDDHAFLLGAVLELMQAGTLRAADLQFASLLAERLLARFEDADDGGFFFTSHDHEALVLRPKSGIDGATPSGNGMAALHLQRLGHLIGEPRYLAAAERTLALFAADVQRAPHAHATLAKAMSEYRQPPALAMLTGPSAQLGEWRAELDRRYLPQALVLALPQDSTGLPAALARPGGTEPRGWICRGPQCLPPADNLESVLADLEGA